MGGESSVDPLFSVGGPSSKAKVPDLSLGTMGVLLSSSGQGHVLWVRVLWEQAQGEHTTRGTPGGLSKN